MKRNFLNAFLIVSSSVTIFAVGELDTTFNFTGKVFTSFGHPNTFLHDVAVQQDGKTIAVGYAFNGTNYDIAVARHNLDGSLDTTFDTDGKVLTAIGLGNDSAKAVAIQTDGKIVVAGSSANSIAFDFAVVRYNPDGSLDTSFDGDGKVTTQVGFFYSSISSIAVQYDGKIVVVGDAFGDEKDFAIVRYQKDGKLDLSFGNNGIVLTQIAPGFSDSAYGVAIQNDGKVVVCGVSSPSASSFVTSSFVVTRYNRNGTLDTTFDEDGKVITSFGTDSESASSIVIQPDGKLVVGGRFGQFASGGILVRYNPNGTLDTSFDGDGIKEFVNRGTSQHIIQPDGKIVISDRNGTFPDWRYSVSRILPNGAIDGSFGSNGISDLEFADSLALQADGKIIVGSTANESFGVARLTGDSPIPSTANIVGRVVDSQNRSARIAIITITNLQTNQIRTVSINPFGYFRFLNLQTNNAYKLDIQSKRNLFYDEHSLLVLGDVNGLVIAAN